MSCVISVRYVMCETCEMCDTVCPAETNEVNGVVVKYTEPPDTAKPTRRWRLYVFKDGVHTDTRTHTH